MEETLEHRLRVHVTQLATAIGERNFWRPGTLAAAADYIRSVWQSQGHQVSVLPCYTLQGQSCENLEITIGASSDTPGIVLAGAHYDTVRGSPGADDNASGAAALLEIARLLEGLRSPRSLKLVAFVNEEPPFFRSRLMGSQVYAQAARSRGDAIEVMLSLEMLGCYCEQAGSQSYPPLLRFLYPDRGDFIAFVSNLRSRGALRRAVSAFRAQCDFPCQALAAPTIVPGVGWSDQLSFWHEGYRALMVTDTAFYRYPHYHSARDTPEKLDYAAMARVVEGLARTLAVLAGAHAPPPEFAHTRHS